MKNSRAILETILSDSQFKPLSQHHCYRRFLELLPLRFQNAIAFITVKNRRLMVALSHPGYKMELNYNKKLLKSLLTSFMEYNPECAFMEADSMVLFVSKYYRPKENKEYESDPRYAELANGEFENSIEDSDLREILEKIKFDIQKNKKR